MLLGMLHAKETTITTGHLGLWLVCTITLPFKAQSIPRVTIHTPPALPHEHLSPICHCEAPYANHSKPLVIIIAKKTKLNRLTSMTEL